MKNVYKIVLLGLVLLLPAVLLAQHHSKMVIEVNTDKNKLTVFQELTYNNQSKDTLHSIVLNDWNNAYSGKKTPLARRFSDEFIRSFHLADDSERGSTENITVIDQNLTFLNWERPEKHPDIVQLYLRTPIAPGSQFKFTLTYIVKVPSDAFTFYGYGANGKINLKNWYLTPSRFENHQFVMHSNNNLDDISNALSDYDLEIKLPNNLHLISDLDEIQKIPNKGFDTYRLNGNSRQDFSLFIQPDQDFIGFRNDALEVISNLNHNRLNDIQKAIIIERIVEYVKAHIGDYPFKKITVSQADYDRNPFYGLNQLPSFISPFSDEFLYEIKFLKTYLNNFLKNTLQLNARNDNWIYDGLQVYTMMKYIDTYHPDSKMMGSVANMRLLKGYNVVNLDFNGQYSYFYMLMARKNLDQPLGAPKNTLIKFNEKIASKYRSGLSLKYLDSFLNEDIVPNSIHQFYKFNLTNQSNNKDFQKILSYNSPKDINWFFDKIIYSRAIIDYKFDEVSKTEDSISFTLKNRTETNVPIPVYGLKNNTIVFKKWLDETKQDSIYKISREDADKIVLNYKNEVPEFNLRNNWKSLKGFPYNNRPIKFNFMKDLEDPYYNQILYVPTLEYNLYDGLLPGFRFHNKTILDKPIIFDLNPAYSTLTHTLSGKLLFYVNQYNRDSKLYNIKYQMSAQYFHYAADAYYKKFNPTIFLRFRPEDLRSNRKETLLIREVIVNREKSAFVEDENTENYSVFNVRYLGNKTEATYHNNVKGDLQIANSFGKLSGEFQYRKLFNNNTQLNLRFFAGTFLYRKTNLAFYNFNLDRPTDYLFDYDYLGRSETTGLFSQQSIVGEGFFKSKMATRSANQWMATTNMSISVWNWIEVYGDAGFVKNRLSTPTFLYDSGVRLNLVTDYFELYFPVYSSNGWEITQQNYSQNIRFIVTFSPDTLINLFTRKWF